MHTRKKKWWLAGLILLIACAVSSLSVHSVEIPSLAKGGAWVLTAPSRVPYTLFRFWKYRNELAPGAKAKPETSEPTMPPTIQPGDFDVCRPASDAPASEDLKCVADGNAEPFGPHAASDS